ncbi:MAG: PP0621 family protein [Lautropia sp.]
MGKLAIWILLALAALLLFRLFGSAKRRPQRGGDAGSAAGRSPAGGRDAGDRSDDRERPAQPAGELMLSCAVCGVHLPGSDALFARGRVYCSAEHRDQDRRE